MIRGRTLISGSGALLLGGALLAAAGGCGAREGEDLQPDHRAGAEASSGESAAVEGGSLPGAVSAAAIGGNVAALAPLLEQAAKSPTLDDAQRQALEQAMQRVLEPVAAACTGCRAEVAYVDEPGGRDHFRCDLRGAGGEEMALVELYHRRDVAPGAAKAWARTALAGHPASALAGEHLFVWPGRFEIRAFGRDAALRSDGRLEALLSGLPLDALAQL